MSRGELFNIILIVATIIIVCICAYVLFVFFKTFKQKEAEVFFKLPSLEEKKQQKRKQNLHFHKIKEDDVQLDIQPIEDNFNSILEEVKQEITVDIVDNHSFQKILNELDE